MTETPIIFDNSFANLPSKLFRRQRPEGAPKPELIAVNKPLAQELGIDADWLAGPDGLGMMAGNAMPEGADPLAQAYAGHQFGGWVPQLGDGRAVLLGETRDIKGLRRDIQLKGSGRTPFSRGGDGRAWLGPVLREYVVSEAMHHLGIPTTRSLGAVLSGQQVMRETVLPGAILTRIARSHVRVGTFQYFAARQDTEALQALSDHVIERLYPDAETPLELLQMVTQAQASLIAHWMSVGFIHGVMNTDNMAISGETIDYGPCAYMDGYDPDKVFSSIDRYGRYAYSQQPKVAVWNLAQFASCLLPLMGNDDEAVRQATVVIDGFAATYASIRDQLFLRKIGISQAKPGDPEFVDQFLAGLAANELDFTNSFRGLSDDIVPDALQGWGASWRARLAQEPGDPHQLMRAANPAVIARNHQVEAMIEQALAGDFAPFERLNSALEQPYEDLPENAAYKEPPTMDQVVHQTFCGT